MGLQQDIPALLKTWEDQKGTLTHNETLFNIHEGNLLPYILDDLKKQLHEKAYEQVVHRVPPINVLRRLIDKLSKIYAKPPVRTLSGDGATDKELFNWYLESMDMNTVASIANEFFNLFKNYAFEPYVDGGIPRLRVIPSDRFFVYSNDRTNPTRPTHFVKCMGQYDDGGSKKTLFYGYTDEEFLIFNNDKVILSSMMNEMGLDGTNPYKKIPFVYGNKSRHCLVPPTDTDTLAMTKIIPILLADLNYATMFQSFSIVYGIDVDTANLKMAPNAFWNIQSDPTKESKPEIGIIKPEVDTDKVIGLIKAQLSLWMETRNIKPGAMGQLQGDNLASGVAKVIDEMDTSEDRQKQIPFFMKAESELFDLIINHMHPVWVTQQDFQKKESFTAGLKVSTKFHEQRPNFDPSKAIDDAIKKIDKELITKKRALQEIYPDDTPEQIEERISELEKEMAARKALVAPAEPKVEV